MQHTGYHKERVEAHKLEIQEILDSLNAPGSHINESLGVDERAANLAPVGPRDVATTPAPESGTSFIPPSRTLYGILITPYFQLQHSSLWTFDQARVCSA